MKLRGSPGVSPELPPKSFLAQGSKAVTLQVRPGVLIPFQIGAPLCPFGVHLWVLLVPRPGTGGLGPRNAYRVVVNQL